VGVVYKLIAITRTCADRRCTGLPW